MPITDVTAICSKFSKDMETLMNALFSHEQALRRLLCLNDAQSPVREDKFHYLPTGDNGVSIGSMTPNSEPSSAMIKPLTRSGLGTHQSSDPEHSVRVFHEVYPCDNMKAKL